MTRTTGYLVLLLVVFAATTLECAAQSSVKDKEMFDSIKNRPPLSQGTIIIAGRNLRDPNFSHAVVLITQYDELGTTGVVLNRPMNMAANKVFPAITQVTTEAGKLYNGGPIGFNDLQILVESRTRLQNSRSLAGNIYLINNSRTFDALTRNAKAGMKVKIIAGYAGWDIGQLESEIMRGDWYIWRADSRIIFTKRPESVWEELIELVTVQWAEYN
jgi:putative transcriptional regulator